MISKNWRIRLFNWLGAGKLKLTVEEPKELMSTYTLNTGPYNIAPGSISINPGVDKHNFKNTITIKVTPANGGNIVSVTGDEYASGELYIIPEDADFDRELGKIITMNRLKQ